MTFSSGPAERLRRRLVLVVPLLLVTAGRVFAHDESVSASELVVKGAELRWTVDVGLAGLAKAKVLPAAADVPGGAGSFAGGERVVVSADDLQARRAEIVRYVAGSLTISLDGRPATAVDVTLSPRLETLPGAAAPAITRAAVQLTYRAPAPIAQIQARVGFFSELTSAHRAVLRVTWDDEWKQMTALGVTEVRLVKGELQPSRWRILWDFLLWGAHHILIGFDHLAFLLALVLAIVSVRELLLVVTSFTIAHSITILLAALDVVRMPPAITEALIAASIVYVAAENLLFAGRPPRGRWLLTFAFGLVHGLGFAEVLRERLAEVPSGLLLPVLAFNLGVELGQLAVVVVIFPLLFWLRRTSDPTALPTRQKQIVRLGSIPLLLAGGFWLLQRLGA